MRLLPSPAKSKLPTKDKATLFTISGSSLLSEDKDSSRMALFPCSNGAILVLERAELSEPGDSETGNFGIRGQHPRRVSAPRGKNDRRQIVVSRERRYLNGLSPFERRGSSAQKLPPGLVSGRRVGDHDNSRYPEPKTKPILDYMSSPANLFATGAGNVNPSRANDPGLVYAIEPEDYVPYLCGLNYTDIEVRVIAQLKVKKIREAQLNCPSFPIVFGPSPESFTRTVTNVSPANSSYRVQAVSPSGVGVRVMPDVISFTEMKQRAAYNVSFSLENDSGNGGQLSGQGFLRWVSSEHSVWSPISVMFK
ncbi:Peptidase S8, subtilisin-related [Parasponia andersonii]|uniref:Peptidase S8, subtilisin-related n=1 Tax=Parasponia andersonii TaxID=3476 RepID=A0A2P5C8Z8_PARAD|nr:Peptidase S8, subtilisin-related [Parasponia andersonii]